MIDVSNWWGRQAHYYCNMVPAPSRLRLSQSLRKCYGEIEAKPCILKQAGRVWFGFLNASGGWWFWLLPLAFTCKLIWRQAPWTLQQTRNNMTPIYCAFVNITNVLARAFGSCRSLRPCWCKAFGRYHNRRPWCSGPWAGGVGNRLHAPNWTTLWCTHDEDWITSQSIGVMGSFHSRVSKT